MPGTTPKTFSLVAPAKVNLDLAVSRSMEGGRHCVDTVMQAISLVDHLQATVQPDAADPGVTISMNCTHGLANSQVALEDNLIYKAIMAFCAHVGRPLSQRIHIEVEKNIPSMSGFGGGSSDCAATIALMAHLLALDPAGPEALSVARGLGSDVAFFLQGGCALYGGFGDQLVTALPSPSLDIVVARPSSGLSTALVYQTFDALEGVPGQQAAPRSIEELVLALKSQAGAQTVTSLLSNSLMPAACQLDRNVAQLIDYLQQQPGVLGAMLSGSGSACFAICSDAATARHLAQQIGAYGCWAFPCTSVSFGAGVEGAK